MRLADHFIAFSNKFENSRYRSMNVRFYLSFDTKSPLKSCFCHVKLKILPYI